MAPGRCKLCRKKQERIDELERLNEFREEHQRLKAACHSLTVRLMHYLTAPTGASLYAVHQILRDVEQYSGDATFTR